MLPCSSPVGLLPTFERLHVTQHCHVILLMSKHYEGRYIPLLQHVLPLLCHPCCEQSGQRGAPGTLYARRKSAVPAFIEELKSIVQTYRAVDEPAAAV
jgi:hypothetical protein